MFALTNFYINMKKTLLTLAIIGAAITANAQDFQGKIFVGTSLGFTSSSSSTTAGNTTVDGPKRTDYSFIPNGGYYFKDNIAGIVGFGINGYSQTEKTNNGEDKTSSSLASYYIGARYTKLYNDMAGFNLDAILGGGSGSTKFESVNGNTTTTTESKTSKFTFGIRPQVVFFPTENLGIEAGFGFLGYNSTTNTAGSSESNDSDFGLNLDTRTLTFGFNYYF